MRCNNVIPEYQEKICFRLPEQEKKQIDHLVKQGKFENKSILIRTALRAFLSKLGKSNNEN